MYHSNEMVSRPPAVTVVVPCYNAAATLQATLGSVLAQTVGDFELIVVDDGSVDGSPELVRELMASDRRIRLVEQTNAGPSTARNRGLALARAKVIALLDADDLWARDHLARHLHMLASAPEVGVSFSPCSIIGADGRDTGETTRVWREDISAADVLAGNPTATCSTLVVRADVFRDAGLMRTDMSHAEDQEWLFRVVNSGWSVRGIDTCTVQYRTSPDGLSASTDRMLAGWRTFVGHARVIAPDVVAANEAEAAVRMHYYFARRAIRTGQAAGVARRHFARALSISPRTVACRPVETVALAGACLAPGLAHRAIAKFRRLRHG